MDVEDDVSMKCQGGISLPFPRRHQVCVPQNHSETQPGHRGEYELCFGTPLLGEAKALKAATEPRARMSPAHLDFLRDGLQLPYLPHLREEQRDLKSILRLLAKDGAFCMGRSLCTDSPLVHGSCETAFLWAAHKAGCPTPF